MTTFFLIFLVHSISSKMVFTSQPDGVYNLNDVVKVPVSIVTTTPTNDYFFAYIICNGIQTQVYQEGLNLVAGAQKDLNIIIPLLSKPIVGGSNGICKIKAALGNDYILTNSFKVSNLINVTISSTGRKFRPGQQILIQGNAIKENKQNANGIANVTVNFMNKSVYQTTTSITNGFFYFNFSLPDNSEAGKYYVKINAYELDSSGQLTNTGHSNFDIIIDQVPTSLELMFRNQSEIAGGTMTVKAILHDQTGKKIHSNVNFTIVDGSGSVVDQETKNTDEFLDVPISYNSPPSTWTVYADSNGLSTQSNFNVLVNKKISVDIINNTILVTNKGNVPYEDPLKVLIGNNKSLIFNVSLGVGESQKYLLSAPEGNYSVEVLSKGNKLFSGDLFLTGNAVNIEQASKGIKNLIQYHWVWGFVIFILAAVLFFLFRRVHKKKFFGKANLNKFKPNEMHPKEEKKASYNGDNIVNTENRAEMSLSMQGDKQNASMICLNINNLDEIKSNRQAVEDTMKRLVNIAESSKSMIYENGNYIFFIFAPIKTKTFQNERNAIIASQQVRKTLEEHNHLFKQKINFGISVNYGTIIANHAGNNLKFMTLGDFSSTAKKLASISKGEIMLSKEIRERLIPDIKSEKKSVGGLDFYILTEVKDRSKNERFIRSFMDKKKKKKKEKKL